MRKLSKKLGIGKLWWALDVYDVCRFNARPEFLIVHTISAHGISNHNLLLLNRHGCFREVPFAHYRISC